MVAADAKAAATFSLAPRQAEDASQVRKLLKTLKKSGWEIAHAIREKAYEGNETRQLVLELEMLTVVPPKRNRLSALEYDKEMYKKRNEVERLLRRLQGSRHIFSPLDKLDCVFMFLIHFALIIDAIISVNTPQHNVSW
jgi:transposase